MLELLDQCRRDDDADAWSRLWLLFDEVAAGPVRRLLLRHGFGEHDAEDVIMDVAASIFSSDKQHIAFLGDTLQQLASWLSRWLATRLAIECGVFFLFRGSNK